MRSKGKKIDETTVRVPTQQLAEIALLVRPDGIKGGSEVVRTALSFYRALLRRRGTPLTICMHDGRIATIYPQAEAPKGGGEYAGAH